MKIDSMINVTDCDRLMIDLVVVVRIEVINLFWRVIVKLFSSHPLSSSCAEARRAFRLVRIPVALFSLSTAVATPCFADCGALEAALKSTEWKELGVNLILTSNTGQSVPLNGTSIADVMYGSGDLENAGNGIGSVVYRGGSYFYFSLNTVSTGPNNYPFGPPPRFGSVSVELAPPIPMLNFHPFATIQTPGSAQKVVSLACDGSLAYGLLPTGADVVINTLSFSAKPSLPH